LINTTVIGNRIIDRLKKTIIPDKIKSIEIEIIGSRKKGGSEKYNRFSYSEFDPPTLDGLECPRCLERRESNIMINLEYHNPELANKIKRESKKVINIDSIKFCPVCKIVYTDYRELQKHIEIGIKEKESDPNTNGSEQESKNMYSELGIEVPISLHQSRKIFVANSLNNEKGNKKNDYRKVLMRNNYIIRNDQNGNDDNLEEDIKQKLEPYKTLISAKDVTAQLNE